MAKELIKIDLKTFFEKEAKRNIIPSYQRLIKQKKGIRLDNAPPNKKSTVKKKGKDHWLVDTGETCQKGFKYIAKPKVLLIYASGERHSGKYTYMGVPGGHKGKKRGVRRPRTEKRIKQGKSRPTYRQIFQWHNEGGDPPRYSGVFKQLPVGSNFPKRMINEIRNQIKPQIFRLLKRRIEAEL